MVGLKYAIHNNITPLSSVTNANCPKKVIYNFKSNRAPRIVGIPNLYWKLFFKVKFLCGSAKTVQYFFQKR